MMMVGAGKAFALDFLFIEYMVEPKLPLAGQANAKKWHPGQFICWANLCVGKRRDKLER